MAWIKTISPQEATGRLKVEYETALKRAGKIWNIIKTMSLNPRVLKSSITLYKNIMSGDSPLSRVQRELIATVVSRANDCFY